MDFSDDTDYDYDHDYGREEKNFLNIDDLIYESFDDILDLYYDFQDRFSFNPFFLGHLRIINFTNLIINILDNRYDNKYNKFNTDNLDLFKKNYQSELTISYDIIIKFLKQFKQSIPIDIWAQFCYKYTDHTCPQYLI